MYSPRRVDGSALVWCRWSRIGCDVVRLRLDGSTGCPLCCFGRFGLALVRLFGEGLACSLLLDVVFGALFCVLASFVLVCFGVSGCALV